MWPKFNDRIAATLLAVLSVMQDIILFSIKKKAQINAGLYFV